MLSLRYIRHGWRAHRRIFVDELVKPKIHIPTVLRDSRITGAQGFAQRGECFAVNLCLLSAVERAFEGFEGDFQRHEFQDAALPR